MNQQAKTFSFELNAFLDIARAFFSCDLQDELTNAITVAFKEGLDAAQFRLSTYINLQVSSDKSIVPDGFFRSHIEHDILKSVCLRDSLFELNSWFMNTLPKYEKATDPFSKYTRNMRALVKANPIQGLSYDKDMSEDDENTIVDTFKGTRKAFAGSYASVNRITPSYVRYSEENQARSAMYELIGASYSQGYMVGVSVNDEAFVSNFKAIYKANMDKPLLIERYDLFADAIAKVVPLSILNQALPLELTTQEQFDALVLKTQQPSKPKPKLNREDYTEKLLKKLESEDHKAEEQRKHDEMCCKIQEAQAAHIAKHGKFSDSL
ncbi:hypothetical protein OTK49_21440 [Vibrio coralliirubri]|uniref:hypothetical protein n=1 Tax=Vibrio coralliirubri TaxID=1516159 RepID=UPI0022841685|nr:hypothetical protein [Vibrio coralliirubri]MCY9865086.1 hypothetical protein [Vibrio coralliirubri]